MTPNVDTILDAALKLPPEQLQELKERLGLRSLNDQKTKSGDVRKYFGSFDSGDPRSADNDKIDKDLVAEYLDPHDPEN